MKFIQNVSMEDIGAVCEIGVKMGFTDTYAYRCPNNLVMRRMSIANGWK